ncbi:MAG: extensin family protein [Hyphomicrobium sp.]|nr:extensin family protein [Hyphomicrobium sp.]
MFKACSAIGIASLGALAIVLAITVAPEAGARDAAKADPPKTDDNKTDAGKQAGAKPDGTADSANGAGKTRKGVRIELKVPQIPGLTGSKSGSKSWPKTVPEAEAEKNAQDAPPAKWSPEEIATAKARCTAILGRIDAIAIPQEPLKEGNCGTPAPIQLISIGHNPEVALSPPAIVNCDFAEALQTWMQNDVQPLAQKYFSNKVIKIEVMSSYSCRNAYGRTASRLSEHGLANALDIRGFVTASGRQAYVLEDWGTPQREILARIAAEKAKAAKAQAAAQAAEKAAQTMQAAGKPSKETPPSSTASTAGEPAGGIARSTIVEGTPKLTVTLPGASSGGSDVDSGFSLAPSRLGGPKEENRKTAKRNSEPTQAQAAKGSEAKGTTPPKGETAASKEAALSEAERKEAFLHAVHAAGCGLFGTTLGPEANAAHRNHLHVDMAPRKHTKICD